MNVKKTSKYYEQYIIKSMDGWKTNLHTLIMQKNRSIILLLAHVCEWKTKITHFVNNNKINIGKSVGAHSLQPMTLHHLRDVNGSGAPIDNRLCECERFQSRYIVYVINLVMSRRVLSNAGSTPRMPWFYRDFRRPDRTFIFDVQITGFRLSRNNFVMKIVLHINYYAN